MSQFLTRFLCWLLHWFMGFPDGSDDKEFACSAVDLGSVRVRKIPWRMEWLSTSVFLPGECHGHRSLAARSPWSCKEWDTPEQLVSTLVHMGLCSIHPCFKAFSKPDDCLDLVHVTLECTVNIHHHIHRGLGAVVTGSAVKTHYVHTFSAVEEQNLHAASQVESPATSQNSTKESN